MPRIERVSYQELMATGSFLNVRLGVDYLLDENDDPKAALKAAKELVQEFHKQEFAQMYLDDVPDKIRPVMQEDDNEPKRPRDIEGGIIHDINTCTNLKVLETYKLLLNKYPKAQEAYDNKLKQLQ